MGNDARPGRPRYDTFDVGFAEERRGGGWRVTVYAAGEAVGDVATATLPREEVEAFLVWWREQVERSTSRDARRVASTRDVGRRLFATVFPPPVARALRASLPTDEEHGLHLVLRLGHAGALADLPWELLHDPDDAAAPLAVRRAVTMARYLEGPRPPRPRSGGPPLRVLVAAAQAPGLGALDVAGERAAIGDPLAALPSGSVEVEVLADVSLPRLGEALERSRRHVVHLVAHGVAAGAEPALLLAGEDGGTDRVEVSRLAAALGDRVDLVVLNACDSARAVQGSPLSGIAQRLVRGGVPAVVAMRTAIADRAAVAFAASFYRALAAGEPVAAAVAAARRDLFLHDQHQGYLETPVLFARRRDDGLVAPPATDLADTAAPPAPADRTPRRPLLLAAVALALLAVVVLLARRVPQDLVAPAETLAAAPVVQLPVGDARCPSPPGLYLPMVYVPAGRYEIGSDDGRPDERPRHRVTLDAYCLGITEVTQEQWQAVMGDVPAPSARAADRPMDRVTWEEARELVRRLDARVAGASHFRLPTEAEWEVAARAGGAATWPFGDDPAELRRYGNCLSPGPPDDGYDSVAPVASFAPNPWGFYDLYGNVSEWVADRYRPYPGAADDAGPHDETTETTRRVRRGGSYRVNPENCRPSRRYASVSDYRSPDVGLRLAAEPLPEPPPGS